jgi:hypothetical protein
VPDIRTDPATGAAHSHPYPAFRPRRWPIVVVRVLAVTVLLQTLVQAALAGGFITGDVDLLGLHSVNGILLVLTAAALLPAAVLLVRPGRGPWWPIVFSVLLWQLVATQVGFGFGRQVGLHIPLGVAITALIAAFTWWSCAYRPGHAPVRGRSGVAGTGPAGTGPAGTGVAGSGA